MDRFDIERFFSVRKAHTPSFSPDGERLSFLMDATGTLQVWSVARPGAWPTQLTCYDERVTFASWSPTRPELAFGMDESGNERTQLYRLDVTDGTVTPLTATPNGTHKWGGWNDNGTQFAFASDRLDGGSFDVFVQDRDGEPDEANCILRTNGWYDVLGWSPEGERLALRRTLASMDHELHVLDLNTGTCRQVSPDGDDARFESVNWGPDGRSLYLVTDWDAELRYLARLDLTTNEIQPLVRDDDWNVEGVNLHAGTGRIAYGVNVDGYGQLTTGELTDPTTIQTYPTPQLPRGVMGEATFDPDGRRLAVTVTTRSLPPTVFVVDLDEGEVERWTYPSTAGIPPDSFVTPELVRYESFDGLEIPAFYSLPPRSDDSPPAVVLVHGGPERQHRPSFDPVGQYLLDRGYAVLEPNIRGSTGYGESYAGLDDGRNRPAALADVAAGAQWLGEHTPVDPERLAVFGTSYGGYLALLSLACYPGTWAVGISRCGIADLVAFLENTADWRRPLREAEYGSLEDDRRFLEQISPINHTDAIDAPLLVVHGEHDSRVPVAEATGIADRLSERGVPVERVIFPEEGHSISTFENRVRAYRALGSFLDEYL